MSERQNIKITHGYSEKLPCVTNIMNVRRAKAGKMEQRNSRIMLSQPKMSHQNTRIQQNQGCQGQVQAPLKTFFGFVNQQIDTTRKYKNTCNIAWPRAPFRIPWPQ